MDLARQRQSEQDLLTIEQQPDEAYAACVERGPCSF
jgi:hypothetical protein